MSNHNNQLSEAPERIWINSGAWWSKTPYPTGSIEYVRADLSRADLAAPQGDAATTARNRDEAQKIVITTEHALGERFNIAARHELVDRITTALNAASSPVSPSLEVEERPRKVFDAGFAATPVTPSSTVRLALDDTGHDWYHVVREDRIEDGCRAVIYSGSNRAFCELLVNAVNSFPGTSSPSDAARKAAEEITANYDVHRDRCHSNERYPSPPCDCGVIDALAAIISRYLPVVVEEGDERPRIICLCGSTRFVDTWINEYQRLSDEGNIVLTVARMPPRPNLQHDEPELKKRLDSLHLRKIDLADEVFVLNVDGYIGSSTRNEIAYAESKGKPISYLCSPDAVLKRETHHDED